MNETANPSEIQRTLEEIQALSESMLETPEEERILVYRQLNQRFLFFEGLWSPPSDTPTLALLDKLKVHLIALARLDDPDQLSDEQHLSAALRTIEELKRCAKS